MIVYFSDVYNHQSSKTKSRSYKLINICSNDIEYEIIKPKYISSKKHRRAKEEISCRKRNHIKKGAIERTNSGNNRFRKLFKKY
jgi:hypothetical protein